MSADASSGEARSGPLRRKQTALVLVDLQYRLLSAMFEAERVVGNSMLLLHLAHLLGIPVILTTQYEAGLGNVHPELLRLARGVRPFDKLHFGSFNDPRFIRHLQAHAPCANTLLVAGVESHICVLQTVLGAISTGYLVHVATDAVTSRTLANWRLGVDRMAKAGAVASSTEMAAYELLGQAGTSEFKAMQAYLK
jgi:nicotinamidase-related amidase